MILNALLRLEPDAMREDKRCEFFSIIREAVIALPDESRAWAAPSLADAERELAIAVREATDVLAAMDVARWDDAGAEAVAAVRTGRADGEASVPVRDRLSNRKGRSSQPRIDRLALQRQHAEGALVHTAQRLALHEALQTLDAQRELAQRQPALRPQAALPQAERLQDPRPGLYLLHGVIRERHANGVADALRQERADPDRRLDASRRHRAGRDNRRTDQMQQYLLSVYHPEIGSDSPPPDNIDKIISTGAATNGRGGSSSIWIPCSPRQPSGRKRDPLSPTLKCRTIAKPRRSLDQQGHRLPQYGQPREAGVDDSSAQSAQQQR